MTWKLFVTVKFIDINNILKENVENFNIIKSNQFVRTKNEKYNMPITKKGIKKLLSILKTNNISYSFNDLIPLAIEKIDLLIYNAIKKN